MIFDKNTIPKLGIGCHKIYGGFEKKRSYKIISAALDKNINYFDTAPRYGDSEKLLGQILKGNHQVIISSKVGLSALNLSLFKKNKDFLKREFKLIMKNNFKFAENYLNAKLQQRFDSNLLIFERDFQSEIPEVVLREEEIRASLYKSLKNLQRNYLDIFFLHEPEQYINIEEIENIFIKLQNEGLIRLYGLGLHRYLTKADNFSDSFITLSMFKKEMLFEEDYISQHSIVHGLMGFYKFGLDSHNKKKFEDPADFLYKVSALHPNKTFLMSPSNEKQLKKIKV
jgi:aryl-alcohol dehydrogenase-like predicted oxidoreductase|tara:strand:- start:340 stop:1191 length:852 start_codon:yes stop_codon:yes gene_type:complete